MSQNVRISDLKPTMKGISIKCIVLDVGPPQAARDGQTIRTLYVADISGSVNLCIWGTPGELIRPSDILEIKGAYANLFKGELTIYTGKNGSIRKVDELCMLFSEKPNMSLPISDALNQNIIPIEDNSRPAPRINTSHATYSPKPKFQKEPIIPVASANIQTANSRIASRDPRLNS